MLDIWLNSCDQLSEVKSIFIYGCEIYCFGDLATIEQCNIQSLKRVLKVNKSTPSCMVHSELGLRPIQIDTCERALKFFFKSKYSHSHGLASLMLHSLTKHNKFPHFKSKYPSSTELTGPRFPISNTSTKLSNFKSNYQYNKAKANRQVYIEP